MTVEDNGPGIVQDDDPERLRPAPLRLTVPRHPPVEGAAGDRHLRHRHVRPDHHRQAGDGHLQDGEGQAAAVKEIMLNTKTNSPTIVGREERYIMWDEKEHGTKVEIYLNGRYVGGQAVRARVPEADGDRQPACLASSSPTRTARRSLFARAYGQAPPGHQGNQAPSGGRRARAP